MLWEKNEKRERWVGWWTKSHKLRISGRNRVQGASAGTDARAIHLRLPSLPVHNIQKSTIITSRLSSHTLIINLD